MNKLAFFAFAAALLTLPTARAQEAPRYTRKTVRPNFFIPESELHHQERLPPFPALENGTIKATDQGIMIKTPTPSQPAVSSQPDTVVQLPDYQVKPMARETPVLSSDESYSSPQVLDDDLSRNPEYIAKLKAYSEDLKTMAQTGVMPRNRQLEADLKKMNSGETFSVK